MGLVLDIEFTGSGGEVWRRFSRIQVEVAIAKPLLPGFFLPRADLPDLWISLKYEKLADVCYNCGTIGHEDRYCSASCFRLQNPQGNSFKAAGQWLRADNDEVPRGIYDEPQINTIAGNLPVSPKSTNSTEAASSPNCERTSPAKTTNAPPVMVQSAEAQSTLPLKDNILLQLENVNVVPPEEGTTGHVVTNLCGETEHATNKEQSQISTHSSSPNFQFISPPAHHKLISKPKTTTQITNPTPELKSKPCFMPTKQSPLCEPNPIDRYTHPHLYQNIPNSSQTIPNTQPTFPILKSSSEADHPLKRKISNEEYAAYAKRLKKTNEAHEPVYFDPETATLIHHSRLEFFILSEREKKEPRPPTVHGEPLKPRARSSSQSPSTTVESLSSNHISSSSQMAEEAGLIMPPTDP